MLKGKSFTAKIIKIFILYMAFIMLILGLAGCLIIHNYINKMNLVSARQEQNLEVTSRLNSDIELELELVQEELNITDSSVDEIIALEDEIRKNMEANSTPIVSDEDVFNVLLIGSDTREFGGSGRSDAMIIVSINQEAKTITTTSLLRDIYLQIPGKNYNRINAAYAYGGADLLLDTIEQNFKIKINRYATIDFYTFIDIVDAIGGVSLKVTSKEIPVINEYVMELNNLTGQTEEKDYLSETGLLLLNGKQALGYARNRYVGNADFERTARQRRVLEQIYNKVKGLSLLELDNLMNIMLPQITTNLTEGELFTLILDLPTYIEYDIEQWSVPIDDSYSFMSIQGMSVLGIDFKKNIKEIHNRIYDENMDGEGAIMMQNE